MAKVIAWPPQLRPKAPALWALTSRTKTGGVALNGWEQIVGAPDDTWQGIMEFTIAGAGTEVRDKIRAWKYLESVLAGRHNYVRMPIFENYGLASPCVSRGELTYGNNETHSSGYGFSGLNWCTCLSRDAVLTGTYVWVHATDVEPVAGCKLTIGDWLHTVVTVEEIGDERKLEVRPALRQTAAAGVRVSLVPTVLVRLTGGEALVASMQTLYHGAGKLTVEEVLNRNGLPIQK